MALLKMAEVFGHAVEDDTRSAHHNQEKRRCPFRNQPCTKGGTENPLGLCSLSDGDRLATLCPFRFTQDERLFTDAGRLAFGAKVKIVAAPEVRILRVTAQDEAGQLRSKKIGKVDYLVASLDSQGHPRDFAALEVQAVYFSGGSMRGPFQEFLRTRRVAADASRRPDWRSSAQKRLMPQLSLKVPVFRRWGKKFFVAVDSFFFASLPRMNRVPSLANSEITWLVYPFSRRGHGYAMGDPDIVFSNWDEVMAALREGEAPDPAEILEEIERRARQGALPIRTT